MKLQKYILSLRKFRVWHRLVGTTLAILLLVSAVTGILLALKKDVAFIQPPTQKGISKNLPDWLPIHELEKRAKAAFYKKCPNQKDNEIDRMDVRPSKGTVKVLFKKGYWEVQLDGATGEVKSIAQRHSDWIEALHDGSIVSQNFKLLFMHVLGLGVLTLMGTGLWLWYAPKIVRKIRRAKGED